MKVRFVISDLDDVDSIEEALVVAVTESMRLGRRVFLEYQGHEYRVEYDQIMGLLRQRFEDEAYCRKLPSHPDAQSGVRDA